MYDSSSLEGRRVPVRLSQVCKTLRVQVAEEIIKRGGLRGLDAAVMAMAGYRPEEDPVLWVPVEKADRVLREQRRPPGQTPWEAIL